MIQETVEQIETRLENVFKNTAPFNSYTLSPSQVAIFRNMLNTIATEIYTLQQLNNTFETEIENLVKGVTTPTTAWWQKQILLFQYNSSVAQVAQLDPATFAPYYPTVVPSYRIITNCAVITLANNIVQIKVTKGGAVLSSPELIALTAYIQTIDPAGIKYQIINSLPDELWLDAEVFYNGQYSAVIQANVIAAIDAYLAAIPFNGEVKISAVEDAIQAVAGVTDVVINSIAARKNVTPFANRTTFTRFWQTYSGQIKQETTSGQTFTDTITFTVDND